MGLDPGGSPMRTSLLALVAALVLLAIGAAAPLSAGASPGAVGVELDANAVHDSATTPPYDWASLFDANGFPLVVPDFDPLAASAFASDEVNSTTDDIFQGGGSKDTLGIQAGPWLSTDSKPQGKDDPDDAFDRRAPRAEG